MKEQWTIATYTCGHAFGVRGDPAKRDGVQAPKIPEQCPWCQTPGFTETPA